MDIRELTTEVEDMVADIWDDYIERSKNDLETIESEETMLEFLNDISYVNTPGFVIERFLKREKALGDNEEDYTPEKIASKLALLTGDKKNDWMSRLNGESSIQKRKAYKLIHALHLDINTYLELKNSINGDIINFRDPEEFIHVFMMQKKLYDYSKAEELINKYKKCIAEKEESEAYKSRKVGHTKMNQQELSKWLQLDNEQAMEKMLDYMITNSEQFQGDSLTGACYMLRFAQYLAVMYPGYDKAVHKSSNKFKDGVDTEVVKLRYDEWGFPHLTDLRNTLLGDVKETVEKGNLLNKVRGHYNNLYANIRHTYKAAVDDANDRGVTRMDVLVFISFFINGFERIIRTDELRQKKENVEYPANIKALFEECGGWEPFDRVMADVQQTLVNMRENSDSYNIYDKWGMLFQIINEVLDIFGYRGLYLPNLFDRFIFLSLSFDDFWEVLWFGESEEEKGNILQSTSK